MPKINRFERGSGCYKCELCKKMTRNTGDEGGCNLCAKCYKNCGIENMHSDNGHDGDVEDCKECKDYGYEK